MCLFFPSRRSSDKEAGRAKRMPSFSPRRHPLHAFQSLVDFTTFIAPTHGGFHKPAPAPKPVGDEGAAIDSDDISTSTAVCGNETSPAMRLREPMVLIPTTEQHLRRLYDALRGRHATLPAEAFVEFIERTQGEVAVTPTGEGGLGFKQFLEAWLFYYGWDAARPLTTEELDLTKPISNYFINSSHNTYLSGNQLTSPSSVDVYRKVLQQNCRCIEIDVWNGDDDEARTPGRSKSPRFRHMSRFSSSSLPRLGVDASRSIEEKYDAIRNLWPGKHVSSHGRSRSTNEPMQSSEPAADDLRCLGRKHSSQGPRSRSRSSRQSSTKSEPIVMHGYTLTSPVGFREVCRAIRETAFLTSPLPIIVSLEVHADLDQQEVMVEIMKEEWDGVLLDRASVECAPHQRQPRLEELLGKILVKVKKPPAKDSLQTGTNLAVIVPLHDDDVSGSENERESSAKRQARVPICESLSALSIYTHSEHFKSFEAPEAKSLSHIFSISETRILELHTTHHREMFAHNRSFFMRAFPDGIRFDSSNPEPSLFWHRGVQMVAMNWQKWDKGMVLNHAMFADSQGWVLKPPGYRSGDGRPADQATAAAYRTLDLTITVYAGQHIPLPEDMEDGGASTGLAIGTRPVSTGFRPCVKAELIADSPDGRAEKPTDGEPKAPETQCKMKTAPGETENPDWGERGHRLHFAGVHLAVEELSFVRFRIEDDATWGSPSPAAWACVRLDRLRPGYRFLNLLDVHGKATVGKLLVQVEKQIT